MRKNLLTVSKPKASINRIEIFLKEKPEIADKNEEGCLMMCLPFTVPQLVLKKKSSRYLSLLPTNLPTFLLMHVPNVCL